MRAAMIFLIFEKASSNLDTINTEEAILTIRKGFFGKCMFGFAITVCDAMKNLSKKYGQYSL